MRIATWVLIAALVVAGVVIASIVINTPSSPSGPPLQDQVTLKLAAQNLVHPAGVARAPGLEDRLFIVDQIGVVRTLLSNDTLLPEPFLDLRKELIGLSPNYDERGLLSIAFHPNYTTNHKLYAFYSAPLRPGAPADYDHTNYVVELTAPENGASVDPATARVILEIDNPYANHNGGQVLFGPDGLLYVTVGDGGGGNDVGRGHNTTVGNAQDLNSIHGKVLRIDIDREADGRPYAIPATNPFAQGGGLPEIFAWGFRNPAYATFDPVTGDLFVADAGQNRFEEVDLVMKGGNYGWRLREGAHCFDPNDPLGNPTSCPTTGPNGDPLIDPIGEFKNSELPGGEGAAVVGGTVYHGNISALMGDYVFGAYRSGGSPLFVLQSTGDGNWTRHSLLVEGQQDGRVPGYLLAVGVDGQGDLLVLTADNAGPSGDTGKVWKVTTPGG
jgi:glucose/arabinose dehydrogenase